MTFMNIWELFERVGLIMMIVGFVALGYFSYQNFSSNKSFSQRLATIEQSLNNLSAKLPITSDRLPVTESCDSSCIRKLVNDAVASMSEISQPDKQKVVDQVVENVKTVQTLVSVPHTQYVTLGSGETSSSEWTTMPGAQVTFNIADFGTVTAVYFEAQIQGSGGKVFVRMTDSLRGSVYGTELSAPGGDPVLVSVKTSIPAGGRTIGVQLRSETGNPAKLLSARLRIDTK